MSANAGTFDNAAAAGHAQGHPRGLYALFATEMWERFSFYSMLALFTLYLQDPKEGFGWTSGQATGLYANYLMFVYASPLIGGWLADRFLGYRKAVMIGGFFFMAGHGLLSIPALWAVYLALTCLVIGNGFFKPNVSTMVGNLYPEGSHLKDRAYNIFYMGINVGAFLAPVVMEIVRQTAGFHAAFAVAAFGMVISVSILWWFRNIVEDPNALAARQNRACESGGRHRGNRGRCSTARCQSSGRGRPSANHTRFHVRRGRTGSKQIDGFRPRLEARDGFDRDLPDRHRLLDGVSPKRIDLDLLGG